MTNTQTICLTVIICWLSLMGVVLYGHAGTTVDRTTHVEVQGR